ncbi:MAG: 50S ribosomal protein L10 [uncultured bacterium (gcode 4)]|uniref:Large ribosomal subunit protein uL10 n=1 Tax=uncultured bacterium (gcode 4) TaxID=1234023 RepID=K2G3K5_9BACT|nr:MAG: 50S ribosomal protein L10 [uncultured bacterium (gcode 4)]
MAVSKAKKVDILAQIEQELKLATSVAFTSNTKLTVEEISSLRRDLRKVDAKFMLAKKTLIRIAFKNVYNVDISEDIMPGQVAVLISKWDKIAGLTVVNKYAFELRKEEKIKFVGAYFDGEVIDAAWAAKLANLPSREVLLSKLLGSMKAPLSALARFLDAAKTDLEGKGLAKVGDLVGSAPKKEVAPVAPAVVETPAAAEEATPVAEETPAEETPAEEAAPVAEETPAEETPAA